MLPPLDLILMVTGVGDEKWFSESGMRSVDDIGRSLAAIGKTLDDYTDVLDFGCGPGRIARWLLQRPNMKLTGIDIQRPMIEWCRDNLPTGCFEVGPPLPPTAFDDASFDLVLNHSVFTHLDERYQDEWLAELARITRADGTLVLSFSGEMPFAQLEASVRDEHPTVAAAWREQLERDGILFITEDTDLGFPDFYHSTFHKPAYVLEHWQQWFELLAYIPRNNLEFQDVVVMGPRAGGVTTACPDAT